MSDGPILVVLSRHLKGTFRYCVHLLFTFASAPLTPSDPGA
jgi:hypothetical protein